MPVRFVPWLVNTSTNATRPETSRTDGSLAVDVMEAVAAAKGVDVMALETTLYEIVDPDALESLFAPLADGTPRTGGKLVLDVEGCEVVVDASGDVTATRPATPEDFGPVAHSGEH